MKVLKIKNIANKIVVWSLLLQMANISIDPVDPVFSKIERISFSEDLSINDIESIYELVSEQLMGIDVPEHDEDDESGLVQDINLFFKDTCIQLKPHFEFLVVSYFVLETNFNSITLELPYPPPKLV